MKPETTGAIEKAAPPAASAVLEWLISGASEAQIREALAQKYPDAPADATMQSVQTYLMQAGRPNSDAVRGWAMLSLRHLYQQMLRVGDFNGCRQAIKEITALLP